MFVEILWIFIAVFESKNMFFGDGCVIYDTMQALRHLGVELGTLDFDLSEG